MPAVNSLSTSVNARCSRRAREFAPDVKITCKMIAVTPAQIRRGDTSVSLTSFRRRGYGRFHWRSEATAIDCTRTAEKIALRKNGEGD